MPTSMPPHWPMFSLVLIIMWFINELEDDEISVGLKISYSKGYILSNAYISFHSFPVVD